MKLDKDVAFDAARNVFAVVGAFGWMGAISAMAWWMALPVLAGTGCVWYAFCLLYEVTA